MVFRPRFSLVTKYRFIPVQCHFSFSADTTALLDSRFAPVFSKFTLSQEPPGFILGFKVAIKPLSESNFSPPTSDGSHVGPARSQLKG